MFWPAAWEDYRQWQDKDRKLLDRINALIEECRRHPFKGTGKPEPLRHLGPGVWSRCITREHRLVYRVTEERLMFAQARYHY